MDNATASVVPLAMSLFNGTGSVVASSALDGSDDPLALLHRAMKYLWCTRRDDAAGLRARCVAAGTTASCADSEVMVDETGVVRSDTVYSGSYSSGRGRGEASVCSRSRVATRNPAPRADLHLLALACTWFSKWMWPRIAIGWGAHGVLSVS